MTTAPDGRLWFGGTETNGLTHSEHDPPLGTFNVVGYVESGKAVEYRWPAHESALGVGGVAVGSDDALWFTLTGRNLIGRLDEEGGFTEYSLPTPDSRPAAIVAGPDGALWFVEEKGDRVGRISTTGTVDQYQLPAGSHPVGIAAGAEGDLWVTESGIGSIARIDTLGRIGQIPIAGKGKPWAIAGGPGGRLWFTLRGVAKIGSIVPGGKPQMLPSAIRGADSILPTSDGLVWYASSRKASIGSVTANGHPTASCVLRCESPIISLAADADGRLRLGLGSAFVEGGGSAGLSASFDYGEIATFEPQPLRIKVVGAGGIDRSGRVAVAVRCAGALSGARCHSSVQLAEAGDRPRPALLSSRRQFVAFSGETRSLPLRLRPGAVRQLRARGRLKVDAVTTVDGRTAHQPLVLSSRGGRRSGA